MAALLEDATRQPRGAWPLRYSALATDQSYRLTQYESGDVGCAATSAQRHSAGSAPGMTALVDAGGSFAGGSVLPGRGGIPPWPLTANIRWPSNKP